MIKIYTDTSANLPPELIKKNDIEVIPFTYTVDGQDSVCDPELEFDGSLYYEAMRRGADVKTSMINIEQYKEAFSKALKDGGDVIYVGMSGGISGAARAASMAADELRLEYPNSKIATIDTYAASLGEGMQVLEAARLLADGVGFDDIVKTITEQRPGMCQYFTVYDIDYLKKGGRVSGAAALLGSILQIKPILTGDDTGHIVLSDKVRGIKPAYSALAAKYDSLVIDKSADIGIAHADNEDGMNTLLDMLKAKGFSGECLSVCYEPVTGAHVGPGTVALFFRGKHK